MPVYQTDCDVRSEEATIAFVSAYTGLIAKRMPDFSDFDYAMVDKSTNQVRMMIEIKNRKADAAKYPTIMLSMNKVMAAHEWAAQGIVCKLVVRVGKGVPRWIDINGTLPHSIKWGGRNGRNHDEPVAHYIKDDFEVIGNADCA